MDEILYRCPADVEQGETRCGRRFGTHNGAVMHSVNKPDDHHEVIGSKLEGYRALEATAEDDPTDDPADGLEAGTVADGGEVSAPEFPEAEDDPADDLEDDRTTDEPDEAEAECPNCGDGLGMTEDEALAFVRANGGAQCENCDAILRDEGR